MKIDGVPYRSVFLDEDGWSLRIVDQTVLPHDFRTLRIVDLEGMAAAITGMQVREATSEVEPATGAVVHAFTSGTMVQVFLLARSVPAETWNESGSGN